MRATFVMVILMLIPVLMPAQVNHRAFIQQARFELSEERYVDALRSLNTAIGVRPDRFEPWFLRGVAKYSLGDFAGAESDFGQALQLHPLHIRSYHYRGLTRIRLANYFDAMQDFGKALELDPYDAGLRIALGDALLHLNRAQEALAEYSMALTIQPRNAEAWTKKGMANQAMGKSDEALADLEQAVHYNTFSLDARLRLALLKAETGRKAEALDEFATLARIHPDEPIVFFQQALVQLEIGDTTAALISLEKVNTLEPANNLATYNRALIYSQLKDYKRAIELFEEVLNRQPAHILSWFNKGVAHMKINAFREAEDDFSRAIILFPGFVAAWLNRADARKTLGNQKGASDDRETAARLLDEQSLPDLPDSPFRNDSLWFNKIMRLQSEFAGPGLAGRPQFAPPDVAPFGLFIVSARPRGQETRLLRDEFSAAIDLSFDQQLVFGFVPSNEADAATAMADPLPLAGNEADLYAFIQASHELQKGNYHHAINGFSSIGHESVLYRAARINLSAAMCLSELIKADAPHTYELTIASAGAAPSPRPAAPKPNLDLAIATLSTLTTASGSPAAAHHNLGYMLLLDKQYHPSIDAFSNALAVQPGLGESWFNRALVLLYLSETRLACHDLSKAGEQGIVQAYPLIRRYCAKP
ncbi:MAG: tetratricopeptide repeat protein [Bacteroidetes bacterium]|nr:tetratricopeptide repeat protein [Bacteroidota bacterium]